MDLIGDIVEHEASAPSNPVVDQHAAASGFPQLRKFEGLKPRNSRFRSGGPRLSPAESKMHAGARHSAPKDEESLTEAQRIHRENLEKISALTEDELTHEREELLQGLDPRLVQTLLRRTEARVADHDHDHAEGYGGWIGSGKNGASLPALNDQDVNRALGIKSVSFREDVEDKEHAEGPDEDAEVAPEGYQIVPETQPEVHFPKPRPAREDPDLDLDDPAFFSRLHEKYFPDLPKETSKLAWMTTPMPTHAVASYEAIGDMRFDFKGNLVQLDQKARDTPTHLGLHHHAENPQLAGYTLGELVHLSRSVVPTQRCLGIQMLGRVLHKLGLHKYNVMPVVGPGDAASGFEAAAHELMGQFEDMMWDLVESLRVVESLTEASDETRTRNLSVRSYAIEALWLWKQGGGRPPAAQKSEVDALAENLHRM
ncbi:hypothetical protein METBIDRAFT_80129 [Metschnikowia bicuspidata var. bicuspidata NRRL YB-4993]|uniref:Uncharacterized protein n=1 Tax=Metschnikowia bicuspidata var. bicuspidata NRRL YB-4993 TaxID=869754 RepID=A0A1A0H1Y9_9ASCO|nr:hypothetical protein METBIDRAFT_80129 [Metschnikowia bicuspidata var. bicuspidata NRRL YB-4993]OBA18046.1 hypothetical protein METBIDRAFT_80129 [Metschnikowia bicuspidata var. bicuspidata NRRL YB-4993]